MVEDVNKASQPGASAIGRRIRFTRLFYSSSVSVESRFRGLGGGLKSVTGVDSSTECNRCKESSLVGDCRKPFQLVPRWPLMGSWQSYLTAGNDAGASGW